MQCVTDAQLKFLDVVARWPGSAHDATIFANSAIRARFETGQFPGCVIIGRYCHVNFCDSEQINFHLTSEAYTYLRENYGYLV